MAVGSEKDDGNGTDSGQVKVYSFTPTGTSSWSLLGSAINGEAAGDQFGTSVSISDNGLKIIASAKFNQAKGTETCHARVFKYFNNSWIQIGSDIDGEAADDQFGYHAVISGNGNIVAGSGLDNDGNGTNSGHVRVYDALIGISPTDISLTSNTISETASIGSLIGILSATDSDTSITSLTFSFTSSGDAQDDDNGSFTISGTSLLTSTTLDYETKTSYNIYVNVSDGTSNYAKAFTVSVTNVLEPITDLGFVHVSKAYKFNGINSYIEVQYAAVNHPAEFTIELWARLDQTTNNYQSPLSSRYASSPWNNLSGYNFYAGNGLEEWSFTGGSGAWESINSSSSTNGEIYDGNTLKFGIWTHLASTYDGTNYRFYVNGVLAGSKTAGYSRVGFNSIPARPLRIGAGRTEGSATYFFNGAVDEVRIWNYVRTQDEINNKKNAVLSGQETGLVSYYSFDNGNASNETGVSARDGTLYNSPSIITRITPYQANVDNVDEESALGTLVGNLTATDSDTTSFTFSLVSGNGSNDRNNSSFTISGTQLLVNGTIDYETTPTLNIYVQASDGTNTFAKALTVNVNDVNELPVITSTAIAIDNSTVSVTFSELVYGGSSNATSTLEVADFALSISGGTATLSSSTPSSVTISGTTIGLGISLSGSADGDELLTILPVTDSVFDSQGGTASTTQTSNTVNLTPPNSIPTDISLSSTSIAENKPIGATVGALSATDSDSGDSHTYSLVAGSGDTDNASFSISGANLLTGTALDYETKNSYSIRVQTSDGTATYAKTFTITVADVFEDADGDGIPDQTDNCQSSANPNQADADADGIGDVCDSDIDGDGFANSSDNCPSTVNLDQADFDADGSGDLCDQDDDNDGVRDPDDAFPLDETETVDTDNDGIGNNADLDDDNDGVLDTDDVFPLDETETIDTDDDGIGNNADLDDDNDGFEDSLEEECDTNPLAAESFPSDFDNDDSPDCIDLDDDNDGVLDTEDVFPLDATETIDTDNDGIGNNADQDDDNDTYLDSNDDFPLDSSEWIDTDGDGLGNNEDLNDDDDYCLDEDDNFPLDSSLCIDTDGDGIDNSIDFDIDGDGVWNDQDDFPLDASESKDTDGDGIGDNTDPDINNDGFPEGKLFISGVLTPQSGGLESTWNIINIEMYPYSILRVFSPDGSLVFKDINYKNDWNGTHYKTGKALATGPYLYQIYVGEKEEPLTGWIYIFN